MKIVNMEWKRWKSVCVNTTRPLALISTEILLMLTEKISPKGSSRRAISRLIS